MALFRYKAFSKDGKSESGTVSAANPQDLEFRLQQQGLYLVSHKAINQSRFKVFTGINIRDLIIFCVHMESLERAGVPILDAIADIRDSSENTAMKNLMTDVHEALISGKMFSDAMAEHPEVFDRMFIGLVASGEKTGGLSDVFKHMAEHLKWVQAIRSKIKKAVAYPIFLLFVIAAVIAQMMIFVVPKMSEFLTNQGFTLPWFTKALIATSNGFVDFWYLIFGMPIIIFVSIFMISRVSGSFRFIMHKIYLKIPFIGPTILKIEMSRFCRFFGISYKSGIDILECMDVAAGIMTNLVVKKSILDAKEEVINGMALTKALENTGKLPTLVTRMFKVGEDSGNLDSALENVNFFYDKEVEDSVNAMVGVIQPALTLFLGFVIMWITVAVFGPLYQSFSKMKF